MIKSIKCIKDIGVFKSYDTTKTNLDTDFTKTNLIFGRNTYGKSTLCDVFKDISDNSTLRISERMTLPDGKNQVVAVNMTEKNNNVSLSKSSWTNQYLKNKILVFDTEFIEKNVFDGPDLIENRETKENFSDFILGDEGVRLAKRLESLKRDQSRIKGLLKSEAPESYKDKDIKKIEEYVDIDVEESDEELTQLIFDVDKKMEDTKIVIKNIQDISNLEKINEIELTKIISLINEVDVAKKILEETYSISIDLIESIEAHKHENCNGSNKSESWLEIGMSFLDDRDCCPFCGQYIEDDNFIKKYQQVFKKGYKKYRESINQKIMELNLQWNVLDLSKEIEKRLEIISEIKELTGSQFEEVENNLDQIYKSTLEIERELKQGLDNLKEKITSGLIMKKNRSSINISVDSNIMDKIERKYYEIKNQINTIIRKVNLSIDSLKSNTTDESKEDLKKLEENQKKWNIKLQRKRESEACKRWLEIKKELDEIEREIEETNQKLEEDQNEYLNKYFEEINSLFMKYGGRKFQIKRGKSSNRGYKKTFGINIIFQGSNVSESGKISKVFSESDRRALALSIFMAKISCISKEEQKNIYLVLDDPVTSFDDNRMKIVIKSILDMNSKVKQTFILTHNFMFSRNMYKILREKDGTTYYKIDNIIGTDSKGIFKVIPEEKFGSELDIAFNKIQMFINYKSKELNYNDLRIFLEEYLGFIFIKQYKDNNLNNKTFAECIDSLKDLEVISKEFTEEIHTFRKLLNPESHEFTCGNDEELRNIANDMLDFLFNSVKLD
ncbi:MAG: AAA family ATPase [Peptoniphilaceae bacterium]